jgi:hypothetical protein
MTRLRWMCCLLAAILLTGGRATAPAQTIAGAAAGELPPLESLQATRERPLFSPTRRPDPVEAPPVDGSPEEAVDAMPFELIGVAVGPDIRVAVIRHRATSEIARLQEGDQVDAWKLEAIAPRYVVLRGETRRVRLRLQGDSDTQGIQVGRPEAPENASAPGERDREEEPPPPEAERESEPPPDDGTRP